ncbi:hypothetical protein [Schauerella aestuarii]|uniref:hypothetical protein n=1 Tax=Schauerella aestuarii TaxID=2511204 RepID=UPI00136FECC3|nr:hypothetical protein [Achromobacter aestuarii]MYZ45901.1 hypothetical protein [Achromobacter aestuarii]
MKHRPAMAGYKTILAIVAGFAAAFVLLGGISVGYSPISIVLLAAVGVLFGAVAAPEIEPGLFRRPILWQMSFTVLGCISVAALLGAAFEGYALAAIVGIVAGYLGPYWIRQVRLP